MFVGERLRPSKPTDKVLVESAHRVYKTYTENPVSKYDFGFYIADNYPYICFTRTKTPGESFFSGCRFSKPTDANQRDENAP